MIRTGRKAFLPVGLQETPNLIMSADRVKVEQSTVGGEYKTQRQSVPAFIETLPQGANAGPAVCVRVPKGFPHLLDHLPDFFSLRFGIAP